MIPKLEGIELAYGYEPEKPVLRAVSVSVSGGEIIGIVGPNGSGKSTLLRLLCGHLKPDSGLVKLGPESLLAVPRAIRAKTLAFLPQIVNPAFALTVLEVVQLGRYPHVGALRALGPHDREVVDRCLHDTETQDLRDRAFNTLSGGERQRVLLASILAQEPDLLLLDEPTSALDMHHEVDIFALLQRLARNGFGLLVVTHNLNVAARFCNGLVLLGEHNSVLAHGAPPDVLTEDLLTRAYGSAIRVCPHPLTGTPLITAEVSREDA